MATGGDVATAIADTVNQALTSLAPVVNDLVTNMPSTMAEAAASLAPVILATLAPSVAPVISGILNGTIKAPEMPTFPPMEMPTLPPMPEMPTLPPLPEMPTMPPMPEINVPTLAPPDTVTVPQGVVNAVNDAVDAVKQATGGVDQVNAVNDAVDAAKQATGGVDQAQAPAPSGEQDVHAKEHFALDPSNTFMMWKAVTSDTFKPFIIPVIGLIAGVVMMQFPGVATTGKLVLYFGSQSFMNIFMGWLMRTSVTVPKGTVLANGQVLEVDLTGCPAGFALTALQQVVSFVVFCIFFCTAYYTPYQYKPKQLKTGFELFTVICFGCVFALNIALNNFSLGYISIAVNLIIRSCLPLTTFLSQQALATCGLYPFKPCRPLELILMTIGVICAGVFTFARIKGSEASGHGGDSGNQILGVVICILSLFCGSLNLALAGVLGECKLNVYDTVAYMAIPATVFLAPIVLFVQKPVPGQWPAVLGQSHMSDWEILQATWSLNKTTMCFLFLSGVLSFVYNIIQFSIVHTLSPSATAFGGNFNKAALVFLTLLLPFLRVHELPGSPYIQVIWGAVIINIAAFSYYSYLQIEAKRKQEQEAQKAMLKDRPDDDDDEDEDDYEESSEEGACC